MFYGKVFVTFILFRYLRIFSILRANIASCEHHLIFILLNRCYLTLIGAFSKLHTNRLVALLTICKTIQLSGGNILVGKWVPRYTLKNKITDQCELICVINNIRKYFNQIGYLLYLNIL